MKRLDNLEKCFSKAEDLLRNSAGSIEASAAELLELLGLAFECDWGTFWKVDEELHVLRPVFTWSRLGVVTVALDRDTRGRSLSLSEGTAGHVWRSRKPLWSCDILSDLCLPRSLDAHAAGLHGGIWFAVKVENIVFGIFEFLGISLLPASEELLIGLEAFGIRIGHQVEKNRLSLKQ